MSVLPNTPHNLHWLLLAALFAVVAPVSAGDDHDHGHEHDHAGGDHDHRQHDAHVHGVAALNVAVDADTLLVELDTPAANIVGFEHPPRDEDERAAIAAARETMADGAALFVPNAGAECVQMAHQVSLDLGSPEDHAHTDGEIHADAHGEWAFTCAKPAALRELDVRLFEVFPGKEKLRVQLITPGGQRGAELTPDDHKLAL
ncbi:DUF2796 domain-containing protein [uncultured Thiohalocapsa sp.]|uniref:DUF2796 domain-containing protein n=1 Tax=uncultured Thiohalocapsa sp. TaxID=768990 RepID=UPI0025E21992|nr:DUF2796 domain-containing protein [uncultured Thiohalocapsa sp.]